MRVSVGGCLGPEDLHCPPSYCLIELPAYKAKLAFLNRESFHTFLNYSESNSGLQGTNGSGGVILGKLPLVLNFPTCKMGTRKITLRGVGNITV